MEKDQIIILENRGLISITGDDAKEFLQNIITNDINKVCWFLILAVFCSIIKSSSPPNIFLIFFYYKKK